MVEVLAVVLATSCREKLPERTRHRSICEKKAFSLLTFLSCVSSGRRFRDLSTSISMKASSSIYSARVHRKELETPEKERVTERRRSSNDKEG